MANQITCSSIIHTYTIIDGHESLFDCFVYTDTKRTYICILSCKAAIFKEMEMSILNTVTDTGSLLYQTRKPTDNIKPPVCILHIWTSQVLWFAAMYNVLKLLPWYTDIQYYGASDPVTQDSYLVWLITILSTVRFLFDRCSLHSRGCFTSSSVRLF